MSDGYLRTCLGKDSEVSLNEALAEGKDALMRVISEAIYEKPERHCFDHESLEKRNMSRIGG